MTIDRRLPKVFGIGWAKTGTTTLGRCFKLLGYQHQGQRLDLVSDLHRRDLSRIMALAKSKESFEDWPWPLLYHEFDQEFPKSKFILTVRNSSTWLTSYKNMIENQGNASDEINIIRRIIYGLPFPKVTAKELIERYERHNNDVMNYFIGRKEDLLIVDWSKGHGWQELCKFLDHQVPTIDFPHENKGLYK
jgi:hypothetical protein